MSKNHIRLDTEQQKQIYERFRYLADRYGRWQVWSDFITMSACSLCLNNRQEREKEYSDIAKRYAPDELQRFAEMFALTIEALELNPNQDFLGDLFMKADLGNTWKGQFFTPYHVCQCMAALTTGNLKDQLEQHQRLRRGPRDGHPQRSVYHGRGNRRPRWLCAGQDAPRHPHRPLRPNH